MKAASPGGGRARITAHICPMRPPPRRITPDHDRRRMPERGAGTDSDARPPAPRDRQQQPPQEQGPGRQTPAPAELEEEHFMLSFEGPEADELMRQNIAFELRVRATCSPTSPLTFDGPNQ
eukprot:scaffold1500_cov398-Prasinococcus_capsulatus_cf.AAC.9